MNEQETPSDDAPKPNVTTDADGGGQQPDNVITFTPSQLKKRLTEERQKIEGKYADYTDLKAQAAKWSEHEAAQMSELEKAQERAQRAEIAQTRAMEEANIRLMRAAFIAEAAKAGAVHPEDAFALADTSEVFVDDDGAVKGAEEAVKALVEAGRLVLSGKPKAPGLDGGAGSGERPSGDQVVLSETELKEAQKLGVSPEQYAKHKRKVR